MDEPTRLLTTDEFQTKQLLEHVAQIRLYTGLAVLALVVIAVFLGIIAFGDGIPVEVVDL